MARAYSFPLESWNRELRVLVDIECPHIKWVVESGFRRPLQEEDQRATRSWFCIKKQQARKLTRNNNTEHGPGDRAGHGWLSF